MSFFQIPKGNFRCAIYTRYSTDQQNPTSTIDQTRNCKEAAEQCGWTVLDEYVISDEGTSGQSLYGRDGLLKLLELAKSKNCPFDGILIDDTSRFGRNLSETLPLTDKFKYYKVFLHFVNRGLDSRDPKFRSLYIKSGEEDENLCRSISEKVHRSHRGRVLAGRVPSGVVYGYRNNPIEDPELGRRYGRYRVVGVERVIDLEQAAVVVRIFRMYVSGLGYGAIAGVLNEEGVPSPLKGSGKHPRRWCARTISKILNQEKYITVHIWNRTQVVRNPDTGRKEQHPRPEHEWERIEMPDWRIISPELWAAKEDTKKRRKDKYQSIGGLNTTAASRKYIFSGRLFCGVCGDKMTIVGGKDDRASYGCFSRRFRGKCTCSNHHMIRRHKLESELIGALAANLSSPEMRATITQEFQCQLRAAIEEQAHKAQQIAGQEQDLQEKVARLRKQEENVTNAVAEHGGSAALYAKLDSLKSEIAGVEALLATAGTEPEVMPAPEVMQEFLDRQFMRLAEVIAGDPVLARQEIHKRVTRLTMTPVESPTPGYQVAGDLALFAPGDVELGTYGSTSAKLYNIALPIWHFILGIRAQAGPIPGRDNEEGDRPSSEPRHGHDSEVLSSPEAASFPAFLGSVEPAA
jgi:DNA invertase Pin-like site-specific DNA recombinase